METIGHHYFRFNNTLQGIGVEHHGSRSWPVGRISAAQLIDFAVKSLAFFRVSYLCR